MGLTKSFSAGSISFLAPHTSGALTNSGDCIACGPRPNTVRDIELFQAVAANYHLHTELLYSPAETSLPKRVERTLRDLFCHDKAHSRDKGLDATDACYAGQPEAMRTKSINVFLADSINMSKEKIMAAGLTPARQDCNSYPQPSPAGACSAPAVRQASIVTEDNQTTTLLHVDSKVAKGALCTLPKLEVETGGGSCVQACSCSSTSTISCDSVAVRSSTAEHRMLSRGSSSTSSRHLSPQRSIDSDVSDSSEYPENEEITPIRAHKRANTSYMSEGQAAVELFLRLNHARQTVDFVKRQMSLFSQLDKSQMTLWEALELLNELREYEAPLLGDDDFDPDLSLKEHAFQTAEACRLAYPEADWFHLVGLIHSLGKLLAHKMMGALPQWAICGESFPVGCRFSQKVMCSQFFSVNPDRRRRIYNTSTGIYKPHCGLKSVYMSWSAAEYLHLLLVLNRAQLPPEALFVLRYQKFIALLQSGRPYHELLSEDDNKQLVWLKRFQELNTYKQVELKGRLTGKEFHDYYDALIRKYIPQQVIFW